VGSEREFLVIDFAVTVSVKLCKELLPVGLTTQISLYVRLDLPHASRYLILAETTAMVCVESGENLPHLLQL